MATASALPPSFLERAELGPFHSAEGGAYVDVAVTGQYVRPGRDGFTMDVRHVVNLAKAFKRAEERARTRGLLKKT